MKILFAASECAPFAKVGGLADVVGSLPKSLKEIGADVSVVLPMYGEINIKEEEIEIIKEDVKIFFNGKETSFNLKKTFLKDSDVPLILIENEEYFKGGVYLTEDASSSGEEDEAARFFFFSRAALETAKIMDFNVIHCHDWHTALIPYFVKKENLNFKTVITIHNLGYQGIYKKDIPNKLLNENFDEDINCLHLGILNSNLITTVSPNYAKEILTPEFGFGLESEIKKRKESLSGIINGIDESIFNPGTDHYILKNYTKETINIKKENKKALQKECFGFSDESIPVFSIISRLAEQKGFDLIEEIFEKLMEENIQFIILGKGMKKYEDFFEKKSKEYPKKFFAKLGFDEKLAHKIYAGSDIFLMPSHFEPCGLGQLIAMKYGTVPLARAVGGLKDTIIHKKTGFLFESPKPSKLLGTIKESLDYYKNKKIWEKIQDKGMEQDFSWQNSAKEYLKIYNKLFS